MNKKDKIKILQERIIKVFGKLTRSDESFVEFMDSYKTNLKGIARKKKVVARNTGYTSV